MINRYDMLRALDKKTIMKIADVSGPDGYGIYKPEGYIKAGMPGELAKAFTTHLKSSKTDYKEMFFDNNGEIIPEVDAIDGLDVLSAIAQAFDLPQRAFMGRGFRAQDLYREIQKFCKPQRRKAATKGKNKS